MTRFRILVAAGLATALTIGTLAAPAAAATKGRVIVANGYSGTKSELCLGNKEIRSTFAYGQYAVVKKAPGGVTIKLRKKAAGTCKGKLLAKKWVNLQAGNDLTLAFSRQAPKGVLFPDYVYDSDIALRMGADVGTVEFRVLDGEDPTHKWIKNAISPTEYDKGEWGFGNGWNSGRYAFAAWHVADNAVIGGAFVPHEIPVGYRYDATLVGTNPSNARWILAIVKNFS